MKPSPLAEELIAEADAKTAVLEVTWQVSAKIGIDCFRVIATYLAQALKADCVLIAEFTAGTVRRVITRRFSRMRAASSTFDLAGSGCSAMAVTSKPLVCRKNARSRFPSDQLLSRLSQPIRLRPLFGRRTMRLFRRTKGPNG